MTSTTLALALIASFSLTQAAPQPASKVDRLIAYLFDHTVDLPLFAEYSRSGAPVIIADVAHARAVAKAALKSKERPEGHLKARHSLSQRDRQMGLECGSPRSVGNCRVKDADMQLDLSGLSLDDSAGTGKAAIAVYAGRTNMLAAIAILPMARVNGEWRVSGPPNYQIP